MLDGRDAMLFVLRVETTDNKKNEWNEFLQHIT
jgi:hypothetical protein